MIKSSSFNTLYVVGSNLDELVFFFSSKRFQPIHLYVVGSIDLKHSKNSLILRFQYIICCWFKVIDGILILLRVRFNTLYVVGSKS